MKNDTAHRTALINYIIFNSTSYKRSDLENYSLTDLVILKTKIELEKEGKQIKKD
jgi:hypothetical protein